MIELKNITKRYGKLTVYKNFNFSLEEGKITCILGESGSGKTTLLNMLAGLTSYEGQITPALKCSYVFQQPRLVPGLTVKGNLMLVCKNEAEADEMLACVELTHKAGAYPKTLSGGQAQRASLARAFLYPSDMILLDEPFSSLDLRLKLRMAQLFLLLQRGSGRTAVFVTHDADEAVMLAHRIVVLKEGNIAAEIVPKGQPEADMFLRRADRDDLLRLLM